MLTRRQFVAAAAGATVARAFEGANEPPAYAQRLGLAVSMDGDKTIAVPLIAAERPTSLPCFAGRSLPLWTFADGAWPSVIRLDLGDRLEATLDNRLPDDQSTSIHWHGIRLPNDQDGVPYLVQPPVQPGESFRYVFTPPDAGTYFFHTHCNTVEQLGRGLEGILIIDGDTTEPYDADMILLLRDWMIDLDAGEFMPFYTLRGAGRAGTYGRVRSVNGAINPEIPLPSAGDCRLRLINSDPTRIMQIAIDGADAAVIAIDGIAVQPFALSVAYMGPATRIDLAVRAPGEGRMARLIDRASDTPVELAHFVASGSARRTSAFDPAPLRASCIPNPDLNNAVRLRFVFNAGEAAQLLAAALDDATGTTLGSLCLSQRIFWTINGRAWPERDHSRLPPPLAVLKRGHSYVFELENKSSFMHPIHIHGHTFSFIRSNKQRRPAHHTDTLLLLPQENAEVAFVADNPGVWMLHCHVIEHQESGMMGYFGVV
ncbi:FtsP/CotA-like multicopper oxidase with cupredoxin domain [Bradyrhizobium elkanii]|uniref:Multicopper oxidase family protein n=1 Tax=Bradyrhizobium brasilense TaxID=1419277 RepID=A0ABY8JKM5_9BRAD|nr:multicopper oxidase family protein [Bradyrhizobium brasilense]MCP1913816.1 FtsP/CotA-like multicopper oxidase with cupredoxin domain [Bradyrhizobium elkanii]WFU66187.1 multicopper oxidase family protein [Bradyrhizobium brasilense]